jgi:hypothetical protein
MMIQRWCIFGSPGFYSSIISMIFCHLSGEKPASWGILIIFAWMEGALPLCSGLSAFMKGRIGEFLRGDFVGKRRSW